MDIMALPMTQPSKKIHLGTICSMMYASIISKTLANRDLLIPQCWNCFGSHIEKVFIADEYSNFQQTADSLVEISVNILKAMGIHFDPIVFRDDSAEFSVFANELIHRLISDGTVVNIDKNLYLATNIEAIRTKITKIKWHPAHIRPRIMNSLSSLPDLIPITKKSDYALSLGNWKLSPKFGVALLFCYLGVSGYIPKASVCGLDVVERFIVLSCAISPQETVLPENVYIHGLILGTDGKKLSRHNKGGILDVELHPDEIRGVLLAHPFGKNIRFDDLNQLKRVKQLLKRYVKAINSLRSLSHSKNTNQESPEYLTERLSTMDRALEELNLPSFFINFWNIIYKDIFTKYIPFLEQTGNSPSQDFIKDLIQRASVIFPLTSAEL